MPRISMFSYFLVLAIFILGGLWAGCSDPVDKRTEVPDAATDKHQLRTAVLLSVQGEVRVKPSGELDWSEARQGMVLRNHDKVRTQRNGFATIQFEKGGVLRLEPESLVAVTDLRLETRDQIKRSTFTLHEGRVEAELDTPDKVGSEFRIKTSSAQAAVVHREVMFQ